MAQPKGYSVTQIWLHWIVAVLILLQFVLNDAVGAAWRAFVKGEEIAFNPLVAQHVFGGILILALVVWRIAIRARRGAPLPPENESASLQMVAQATHGLLYMLIIALVVSGGLAWFGNIRAAAETHEVMTTLLMILVGLHVVGALYHQFVLKTNLMVRMKRPLD